MRKFVDYALQHDCTDIFVDEGKKGSLRSKRVTHVDVTPEVIKREGILNFIKECSPTIHEEVLGMLNSPEPKSVDAALEYKGRRFRANICKISVGGTSDKESSTALSMVLRILHAEVPDITKLNLPESIRQLETYPNGLVLIVGETGSGKTMTIAGCLQMINQTQKKNIITIENPIEYMYESKKCRIVQREVGKDVASFADGVRDAMRQAPDIILVGEMRDLETIKSAIELAETGHLVFGTLHAKSCVDTVDRLVDVFPPGQQQQIRVELAGVLRTVVHQRLVKNFKGSLVPLTEIMVVNNVIAAGIKDAAKARSNETLDYMRANPQLGNVHEVNNAVWHYRNGRLNDEDITKFFSENDASLIRSILVKAGAGAR